MRVSLRRLASFALALVCCAVVAAAPPLVAEAHAQAARSTRVRDALQGEARAAFDRASVLFRAGDFNGARVEFEQAHRLSGEPRVLYNVAVCDKELHRYARAVTRLKASLAARPLPADYVRVAQGTLAVLEPLTSRLAVEVSEAGAQVFVDDEPVGMSPLPEPLLVDVGEHGVVARKSGFLEGRAVVTVASGAPATVRLALEPLVRRGTVEVRAEGAPGPLTVWVDGKEVGDAPWAGTLDEGTHRVQLRGPGLRSETRTVAVENGKAAAVVLRAVRDEPRARLRVVMDDPRGRVFVDGELIGSGPLEQPVSAGSHRIRVERSGEPPFESTVYLAEQETRTLTLDSPKGGVPVWVYAAAGVAVTAAVVTVVLVVANPPSTSFQGSSPGTLPPRVVLASF